MVLHEQVTWLAKLGFAARGLVYLVIGWFAIDAAIRGGTVADNQGAIGSMADEPFGQVLLAVIAAGLFGYALWRVTEALADPERTGSDGKAMLKRAAQMISGVAHIILGWTAAKLALRPATASSSTSPGDESARDWTAWLLSQPLGRVLVATVAIGLFAAALLQAKKAWKGDFVRELRNPAALPGYVCTMGRIGYGARSLVFAIIGGFFAVAAYQSHASEAGGMADALGTLQAQPGGAWLLLATGIGLGLFGAYSLIEARFRRISVELPG